MKGKVWLVGAGPSDVGLLTLKGKEVLEKADVVVYDRLVGISILNLIPDGARCIDVGKNAGNHTMPQWQINELLLEEAKKGNRVVRLKGGDPFLFGRGGEELELLAKNGIPFEEVPGVTSAIAVPAYNGIPVTHRDCTSSLHIVTGHKKQGDRYDMDFKALAATGSTLVFLMGVTALPEICSELLSAGMDPETPAALLQKGTSAGQRRILATLGTLAEEVARHPRVTPAIFMIGKVCKYAEEFAWYEHLPLFGHRILVTRPKERAGTLSSRLRELGAEVIELPAIETISMDDLYSRYKDDPEYAGDPEKAIPITINRTRDEVEETCSLKDMEARLEAIGRELSDMGKYDYIAFTSPAGVKIFFDMLRVRNIDVRRIGDARMAAIGPGTAAELKSRGLLCDIIPERYDGKSLGKLLYEVSGRGENILIPRARIGGDELVEELKGDKELKITDLPIYETVYGRHRLENEEHPLINEPEMFEKGEISMAVFTSASTIKGFTATTRGMDHSKVRALCIGSYTGEEAAKAGMNVIISEKATVDSLVEKAVEIAEKDRQEGK